MAKKASYKELERKNLELNAQLAFVYASVYREIDKASVDKMMASGVLLQLTALGGRELISPVVIRDGLSNETIEAIKKDLKRSYDLAVMYKI